MNLDFTKKKPIQLSCLTNSARKRELKYYCMNLDTKTTHAQSTRTLAYAVKTKLIGMIHHLVKDAIESLDDPTEFDYLKFMSYYNLKTMTNEVMVKEEYFALME